MSHISLAACAAFCVAAFICLAVMTMTQSPILWMAAGIGLFLSSLAAIAFAERI
jgi:hypothetical protein